LFNGPALFNETVTYFKQLIELGEALGITHLVFGAYQSRLVGTLEKDVADTIFIKFLLQVSDLLKGSTMSLLIEPVPKQYGTDYLLNHREILNVLNQTNRNNVGLLLDLGAFYTNQETDLEKYIPVAKHIHLAVPGFGRVDRCIGYPHLAYSKAINGLENTAISIEMFEHAFKINPSTELKEMLASIFTAY
jgi:hydroxypyruvate isomerase